jgi:hypothetical protein
MYEKKRQRCMLQQECSPAFLAGMDTKLARHWQQSNSRAPAALYQVTLGPPPAKTGVVTKDTM